MSQSSLVLPNTGTLSGLSLVNDVNAAFDALSTCESGPTNPSTTEGCMLWMDTTNLLLMQRNVANGAWNVLCQDAPGQVIAKNANYTAVVGDYDATFSCTGTMVFTMPVAATIFNGWKCRILNLSGGTLTIAAGSGYFYGSGIVGTSVTSFVNPADNDFTIVCDGTNFITVSSASNHGHQLFQTSGTFVVPTGVTLINLSACGGGGGGGAGGSNSSGFGCPGGGGGGGATLIYNAAYGVAPGSSIAVTIGGGGGGGGAISNAGGAGGGTGGSTVIAGIITLAGGSGGGGGGPNGGSGGGGGSGGSYGGPGTEAQIGSTGGSGGGSIYGVSPPTQKGIWQGSGVAGLPGLGWGTGGSGGSSCYSAAGGAIFGGNGGAGAPGMALFMW